MDHTLRILHLEDLPSDAELIERVLRKSGLVYEKLVVDNRLAYSNALSTFCPDIVLSDHALPAFSSPEALAILKGMNLNIPFILITSTISEEFAVDIIKQGAADYILKDRLQRLPSAVNAALEINRLEKEKQNYIKGIIENEALMKEAEQMAGFGSFYFDTINGIARWSDECCRILGYRAGETKPSVDKFMEAIHKDDIQFVLQAVNNAENHSNFLKINYRTGAENNLRYIYSELAVKKDAQGKPVFVKGFIHDVTSVKKAQESLKASEANLKTIFSNTDTAYVLFSPGQQIISFNYQANAMATDLYRKALQEGEYACSYFPENRMPFINDFFYKAINGENTAYESNLLNRDGEAKWYYTRWLGIADDKKLNFGVIMAVSDITERKLAELDREKIAGDLIKRNNALEQFAFIVSHNLRAPVANIIGLTDAITTWQGPSDGKEYFLNGLSASAKKLDEVVYDLNHILRISQRVNEQKEVVYFQQLVEDVKLALGARITVENVVIKTDFTEVMNIYTLKSYLHNIFYNLILNSINFKQPFRSPFIEIKSSMKGELHTKLVFKDNGRGIDLAKHGKKIFCLYQRFDTSVEGRGMGLCMAKTQAETLGGKISVESELNKGAVFTVELPV